MKTYLLKEHSRYFLTFISELHCRISKENAVIITHTPFHNKILALKIAYTAYIAILHINAIKYKS